MKTIQVKSAAAADVDDTLTLFSREPLTLREFLAGATLAAGQRFQLPEAK